MLSTIEMLWNANRLPIIDALHYADGRSYAVELVADQLHPIKDFDLVVELRQDPDWVTAIDITQVKQFSGGSIVTGEGSWGSEGFFARLGLDGRLNWVCYLAEANPFDLIDIIGSRLTAISTSDIRVLVDIDFPI